jgi:uncharacterized protein YbjT (DUF2867 family)
MRERGGTLSKENGEQIAVVGASGYVANRLVPALLDKGHMVVACARRRGSLQERFWIRDERVRVEEVDVLDGRSLGIALAGCQAAYYLVHSMNPEQEDFAEADRVGARSMVDASEEAGVSRVIYLGGLGEEDPNLSKHLRSRVEVGNILLEGPVPTTVLRAAIIIGAGSASFEIIRYLVNRLPFMLTPRWVQTESQPIAISNVIKYLVGCLEVPGTADQSFDIGGPEVVTYIELMNFFAKEAGLSRRIILPVPVLSPRLSSYWIHLMTPVPSSIAQPLAEGLRNRAVCENDGILELVPQELLSCRDAIRRALDSPGPGVGEAPVPESLYPGDAPWAGGSISDEKDG